MILADGAVSDRSVYTSLTPVHAPSSNGGVVGKLEAAETLDRGSTSFALPLFYLFSNLSETRLVL